MKKYLALFLAFIVLSSAALIGAGMHAAAPANAARLHCNTPCVRTGKCVSLMRQSDDSMCAGCASEDRICANYVVSARQREVGRIKVILVGEELGF